jgi:hypothetical protein
MHDSITTGDVYESIFYLLNGATLESIQGVEVNGQISCQLYFTGYNLAELQAAYFSGKVTVNLYNFRRSFSQVNAWIANAKKKLKQEMHQQKLAADQERSTLIKALKGQEDVMPEGGRE